MTDQPGDKPENGEPPPVTLCTYCGVGDPVAFEPRPDRPDRVTAVGPLGCCSKGAYFAATNARGERKSGDNATRYPRLTVPKIRRGDVWADASWDEALDHVAVNLLRRRAVGGRRAIAFYGVGQAPIESYWIAKKLFQGYLGTNHVGTNAELCLAASAGGHELVFGNEGSFTCYEDYLHADAILLYGSNQAINHPTIFRKYFLKNKQAVRFVVDPRVTQTVRHALKGPNEAHHVRIRGGGDVLLNAAVAHRLFEKGWVDQAYLDRYVDEMSIADYRAFVGRPEHSPASVARRLAPDADGVPVLERQIERMAEVWGRRPDGAMKVVTTSSVGINQATGSHGVASILNLHALTGTVGKPGEGHVRLAGQSNAPSELAMGFSSLLLPFRLSVKERRHRVRMAHHWGIPPYFISELPGVPVTHYAGSEEITFLLTMGCDYARNLTEIDRLRQTLRDDMFVVTCDAYPNPEAYELADVLLPARTHGEVTGAYMTGERRMQLVQPIRESPPQAWDDVTILVELARHVAERLIDWDEEDDTTFRRAREKMLMWTWIYSDHRRWPPANPTEADVEARAKEGNLDLDPHPIRAAFDYPRDAARQVVTEAVWNELREASTGLYNELADERGPITYARMLAQGRGEDACHWGGLRRYTPGEVADGEDPGAIFPGRFVHTCSRARLHVPDDDLIEDPRPEGVWILNTGRGVLGEGNEARNVAMFNSCVKSGYDDLPAQHVISLHPDDAAELGVTEGDLVEISSSTGAIVLPAHLTDEVIRREPYVPFQPDQARTPLNRVVQPVKLDPIVNQPRLKRMRVDLRKAPDGTDLTTFNAATPLADKPAARRTSWLGRLLGRS